MLAEMVQKLVELGVQAKTPLYPDKERNGVWLRHEDGDMEFHANPPPPRNHTLCSLESLCQYASDCNDLAGNEPVLWYSEAGCVLITRDSERFDRVSLKLSLHSHINTLRTLDRSRARQPQAAFLSMLRIDMHGMLGTSDIVNSVRKLKFRTAASGDTSLQHGKASLGRSLEAELTGAGTIPEMLSVFPTVFREVATPPRSVQCAIDINPEEEKLALIPLPGAVDDAIAEAVSRIGQVIRELVGDDFKVYHGVP